MVDVYSGYLHAVFDSNQFGETVARAKRTMLEICERIPVDAIAFTGVSGAALGFILGEAFKLPIVCLRKGGENTHSYSSLEGELGPLNYLIVDDLAETGDTVSRIAHKLCGSGHGCKISGVMFYRRSWKSEHFSVPDCDGRLIADFIQQTGSGEPRRYDLPECPVFGLLP